MTKINKKNNVVISVDLKDLPIDLQVKLNRALEDYKTGNYIFNEEMKEKSKKWFLAN